MSDSALAIKEKNLIFCGGSKEDREDFIVCVKKAFHDRWPEGSFFQLSEHIKDSERFLKSARSTFPIKPLLEGQKKYEMSYSQLNDSYLAWVGGKKAVLAVIPEFDKIFKTEPDYFYQILGEFLAAEQEFKTPVRLLLTFSRPIDLDFSLIPVIFGGDWKPSAKNLQVIKA